jgi:hypothetical protein
MSRKIALIYLALPIENQTPTEVGGIAAEHQHSATIGLTFRSGSIGSPDCWPCDRGYSRLSDIRLWMRRVLDGIVEVHAECRQQLQTGRLASADETLNIHRLLGLRKCTSTESLYILGVAFL